MSTRPDLDRLKQQLRQTSLFEDLDEEIINDLAHGALWREYEKGEVVFLEGEASAGLYYLQFGWLKAVKSSTAGREQVLRFLGPGEIFNEIGVFAGESNPATAIALEPVGLWLLRRLALLDLLRRRPHFAQFVIQKIARRTLHLVDLVADLSLRSVNGRLARLLLEDATEDVFDRPRWYTQTELAARLGTVPDVIQRALRTLQNDGIIDVERHMIRIQDRQALEDIAA